MPIETLVTFVLTSAILSFAPGPDNIFVLTQSALHGRYAGFMITLGLCTGLIIHTIAVAFGVAAIFMVSAHAFTALKLVGAAYLLYLSWQALKASASSLSDTRSPVLNSSDLFKRGIIMNLTNPKIAIFFLAFLPQFANPNADALSLQLIMLGGIFIIVALIVFSIIACLSGFISTWLRSSDQGQVIMQRIAALVFFGLAVRLATTSNTE